MTVSRGLGYWTTGRLSTYLKMLFLGLTIFFCALGCELVPLVTEG